MGRSRPNKWRFPFGFPLTTYPPSQQKHAHYIIHIPDHLFALQNHSKQGHSLQQTLTPRPPPLPLPSQKENEKKEKTHEEQQPSFKYKFASTEVVMMTTSTFCLFVHGSSAWYVFTLDVAWALAMVFINQCPVVRCMPQMPLPYALLYLFNIQTSGLFLVFGENNTFVTCYIYTYIYTPFLGVSTYFLVFSQRQVSKS